MLAGNIAGKTRTLPLAIYSAVASGDWRLANQYVVIMLLLCLIILFLRNFLVSALGEDRNEINC